MRYSLPHTVHPTYIVESPLGRKRATCLPRVMQPPNVMRCNASRESTQSRTQVHNGYTAVLRAQRCVEWSIDIKYAFTIVKV